MYSFVAPILSVLALATSAADVEDRLRIFADRAAIEADQQELAGATNRSVIKYDSALLRSLGLVGILSPLKVFYNGAWHVISADGLAEDIHTQMPLVRTYIGADGSRHSRTQANFSLPDAAASIQLSVDLSLDTGRVEFAQSFFGSGLNNTNYRELAEESDLWDNSPLPQAWFPFFEQIEASVPWAHMLWAGCQIQSLLRGVGNMPNPKNLGYHSAPLVYYKNQSTSDGVNVAVLSHLGHFKNSVMTSGTASGQWLAAGSQYLALGLSGELTSIPQDTTYSAVLYPGSGIAETMHDLGQFIVQASDAETDHGALHCDKSDLQSADVTLTHLGFFTDNGAQFYGDSYNTNALGGEHGREYNLTCCTPDKIYAAIDKDPVIGSSINYLQLDDWWYVGVHPRQPEPRDQWGVKCVESWRWPDKYKTSDQKEPFADFKGSLMLYAPYFCPNNTYASDFEWVRSGNVVTPKGEKGSYEFHKKLFEDARQLYPQFVTYEVDFMNELFLKSRDFRTTLGLYEAWANGMNAAAAEMNLTIQYCMMLPSDIFMSSRQSRVSNGRASQDYTVSKRNWDVTPSSLLLDSFMLRPSKDNFWTSPAYPDDSNYVVFKAADAEPAANLDLHSLVALNSLGPVGPSDMNLNRTILERCIRNDGLLLGPDRPMLLLNRFWSNSGRVAATSMQGGRAYNVLIADMSNDTRNVAFARDDFYPKIPKQKRVLTRRFFAACNYTECPVIDWQSRDSISIDVQGFSSPFSYNVSFEYVHAYTYDKGDASVILGEVGKYAPLSPRRFSNIHVRGSFIKFTATLGPGESTEVAFYFIPGKRVFFQPLHNPNMEEERALQVSCRLAADGVTLEDGEDAIVV